MTARAPGIAVGGVAGAALVVLVMFVAAVAAVIGARPTSSETGAGIGAEAARDIPPGMLALYQQAAAVSCPGLDPSVLAAVGKVETDHGRSRLPGVSTGENYAGAAGPMQFLRATFAEVVSRHPPPPGGAVPPSRYNAHDAVHTAAAYLCDSGAPADLRRAMFTYNHSSAYVADVLAQANRYRAPTPPPAPTPPALSALPAPGAGGPGAAALAYARGQIGLPYLWGGDGPASGEAGFDCSGLTAAAWASAGTDIPRTAQTQYAALAPVPIEAARPGDLFFFGVASRVHHVGIATGQGTAMIHAPRRGSTVRVADAAALPDLLSAARPT